MSDEPTLDEELLVVSDLAEEHGFDRAAKYIRDLIAEAERKAKMAAETEKYDRLRRQQRYLEMIDMLRERERAIQQIGDEVLRHAQEQEERILRVQATLGISPYGLPEPVPLRNRWQ